MSHLTIHKIDRAFIIRRTDDDRPFPATGEAAYYPSPLRLICAFLASHEFRSKEGGIPSPDDLVALFGTSQHVSPDGLRRIHAAYMQMDREPDGVVTHTASGMTIHRW